MVALKSDVCELTELETESIEYFVSFVQLLGLPKSVGEIYGVLFVSPDPMALDDIVTKLGISKGSGSQGIGVLRNLGAIQLVEDFGERKDYYKADFDLVGIFSNFSKEKLIPRFKSGNFRLERLEKLAAAAKIEEGNGEAAIRIKALSKWQARGAKLLPLALKFLKATKKVGKSNQRESIG